MRSAIHIFFLEPNFIIYYVFCQKKPFKLINFGNFSYVFLWIFFKNILDLIFSGTCGRLVSSKPFCSWISSFHLWWQLPLHSVPQYLRHQMRWKLISKWKRKGSCAKIWAWSFVVFHSFPSFWLDENESVVISSVVYHDTDVRFYEKYLV